MVVTQCPGPHICELNGTLRARVHEVVAVYWVELGSGDDLCQLFHVDGFDIDDVCESSRDDQLTILRFVYRFKYYFSDSLKL